MKIIGLTGSIGMGKSVAAKQWQSIGVPVHDADAAVHLLLKPNSKAFPLIQNAFPEAIVGGEIDRKLLGKIVFQNQEQRKKLEAILHPLVRESSHKFIEQCRRRRVPLCVLDIPLLFETRRDKDMDIIMCVTAPKWVQHRRVMSRPGMTIDKFKAIAKTQMHDYRKRALSDYVVITSRGRRHTLNAIKRIKNNEQF